MKTLYLVRHAKSSWDDPTLDDFDRPLNDRGLHDAPRMGNRLDKIGVLPDIIYASPAARALTTAKILAKSLQYSEKKIHTDRQLYHASEETWLNFVRSISDKYEEVMLVGHNPGLSEFAQLLVKEFEESIPTTGVVAMQLPIESWKEVKPGNCKLKFFDYPKKKG